MNELPLKIFVEDLTATEPTEPTDFEDENLEIEKRVTSGVRCFWCYELAKRAGLDPDGKIKRKEYGKIEWIFHCPIDPSTGKLCCPKLLDAEAGVKAMEVLTARQRKPAQVMVHEEDDGEDELAAMTNGM